MKIKSLTGLMLGAAFFAAAQLATPQCAEAKELPFSRDVYEHAIEQAYPDPRGFLSKSYGKTAAVEDIMAVQSVARYMDNYALTQGIIDDLTVFASHPDEKTRIEALRSIAFMAGSFDKALWSHAFEKLKTFDTDRQTPAVRAAVMEMAGMMGGPIGPDYGQDIAPYLLSRLKTEAVPEIKAAAIRALDFVGGRDFNAQKAEAFRQYNNAHETDIVRGAAVHGFGMLGLSGRIFTEEAMRVSIDALRVENPGIVVREAADSAVGLLHMNRDNDNYIGNDAQWVAQIAPLLMAVLQSGHDDDTRLTALWRWASIAFNFKYANAMADLNTATAVRLSDPEKQEMYDKEVAAVRGRLQPASPAPQP